MAAWKAKAAAAFAIPIIAEILITGAKWGVYPTHSVRDWYGSLLIYELLRLIAYSGILYAILKARYFAIRRWFHKAALAAEIEVLPLFFVSLGAEVSVSWLEWTVYPWYLTEQWYGGSFATFELIWAAVWCIAFWVLFGIGFLVASFKRRAIGKNISSQDQA